MRRIESICRRSSVGTVFRGGCAVEEGATRKFLLEVVELREVEPNLPSVRAGARDPTRAGFHFKNSKMCLCRTRKRGVLESDRHSASTCLDLVLTDESMSTHSEIAVDVCSEGR